MKIKGYKKLNKAITKVLKPFGITKAKCIDEYSYIFENDTVTFKLTEGTIEDELFKKFIKERFNYKVKYPFVISLLHECGHANANNQIEDDILTFCLIEKERINNAISEAKTQKEVKRLEYQYFNLPDEIMATQWAVNYAKKHPKRVEKMWKECEKALHKFYERNRVK